MNDIEIANSVLKNNIVDIASKLSIDSDDLIMYGNYKAKINKEGNNKDSKLILVTAINPTPYGEGKTTVSIGLADAMSQLNKKVCLALREPSMGPVFGMKGGATGGGYSQVIPMEDINLHFTGDFAAIEMANNLLCAAIDNHIEKGNYLRFSKISFSRCLDVNDRSLRNVTTKYKTSFNITAASEVMALLCLAKDIDDLKYRLGNIIVGYNELDEEIYARDLKIEGALTVILKDAIKPNLVQTLEHTPAIIHGGPFANIAHGCNSVIATKYAKSYASYVVTEAGFGSDLGAEKFFDIKCRVSNMKPDAVVLVTTIKALKYNAKVSDKDILVSNPQKVEEGLCNLKIHIENLLKFNSNLVVCINKYNTDTNEEIDVVKNYLEKENISYAVSTAYVDGGKGAITLAEEVLEKLDNDNIFNTLYNDTDTIYEKISKVSSNIYRSSNIEYSEEAKIKIDKLQKKGFGNLPICISKTQYSISDDPKSLGAPINNTLHVKDVKLYNGAGFITILTGNIMTMPGLPSNPNYEKIDYIDGKVVGLS